MATILALADPAVVVGVGTSAGFLGDDRARVGVARASFVSGDARALPMPDGCVDAVVSGLVFNFVPGPYRAASGFARVAVSGAVIAAFVGDYAEGMAIMRHFWDVATAVDPDAAELDEGRRFRLCRPDPLADLWAGAGLEQVMVQAVKAVYRRTCYRRSGLWQSSMASGYGAGPGFGRVNG